MCQEIHNQYLDKWIYAEQQTPQHVQDYLVQRNAEWLNDDRRSLLQSFVQMPTDLIPTTNDLHNLYRHFAQIIVGENPISHEEYDLFQSYHYLIGDIRPLYFQEDPVPDLTREEFNWVRTMLEQDGDDVSEIPADFFRQEITRQPIRIQVKPGIECSVCYEQVNYERCVSLQCHHQFCMYCVKHLIQDRNKIATCPMCRDPIQTIDVHHDWVADELHGSIV
jgi:hypothetical protein